MFNQYDTIKLKREIKEVFFGEHVTVSPGTRGVIMEIYSKPSMPNGFDVEFFDASGQTIAVTVVQENDIEPWTE